jgi:type IV secretory pathway VirB3-like protein
MSQADSDNPIAVKSRRGAFRRAVLRGLALVAPLLLTVVIFLWIGNTIYTKILQPIHHVSRDLIAWQVPGVELWYLRPWIFYPLVLTIFVETVARKSGVCYPARA